MGLQKFIPLTKIDVVKRLVYGIATAEQVDKAQEICDYPTTKVEYQKWSADFEKNTNGKSKGNLRAMHSDIAAGKLTEIHFNDDKRQIEICAKVVDDAEWKKVEEGVYTGFSQGGDYGNRWADPVHKGVTRYTAVPAEVSLVDNPCLAAATFEAIKADGSVEMRKFQSIQKDGASTEEEKEEPKKETIAENVAKLLAGVTSIVDTLEKRGQPEQPKADEPKGLAKLLKVDTWDVQCALDAICAIECLIASEEWQAMFDGKDQGTQIADLKAALDRLKSFIASEIQEPEMERAEGAGDLEKTVETKKAEAAPEAEALQKSLADEKAKTASAEKERDEAKAETAALTETVTKMATGLEALTKRLKALEDQPAETGKGALFIAERGNADGTGVEKAEETKQPQAPQRSRLGMSPAEARAQIRSVASN